MTWCFPIYAQNIQTSENLGSCVYFALFLQCYCLLSLVQCRSPPGACFYHCFPVQLLCFVIPLFGGLFVYSLCVLLLLAGCQSPSKYWANSPVFSGVMFTLCNCLMSLEQLVPTGCFSL